MIDHISISDFAIIRNTEIDFEDGLNIITGETGSGKSIVIEAVSLALGSRADSGYVRHGAKKARVQLQADLDGEEVILAREVSAAGKNLCRVNGELVTRGRIAEEARKIADIHGQYDNVSLLDPERHLTLVDQFHKAEIRPYLDAFREAYHAYRETRLKLEKLVKEERENRRKIDFYTFELKEINEADLRPEEEEGLSDRLSVLKNSEKIFAAAGAASSLLTDGENDVLSLLGEAERSLGSISSYSAELTEIHEGVSGAYYELQDLAERIRRIADGSDFDPSEVDQVISRLEQIDRLKKKYGADIPEILAYRDRIAGELSLIENFDEEKEKLEKETKERLAALKEKAEDLTLFRTKTARELSAAIEAELHDLNFKDAKLVLQIRKAPAITQNGQDECEIMISTNPGEPLKPLAKTASGGEISRIMLAIKNVTGDYDNVPTMIFDEIDAGISGITASVVARKLKEISREHQIICITHLPQIAAAGDVNFRIYKDTENGATFTHVEKLSEEGRRDEIARLLGGDSITDTTRKSAEELIAHMHESARMHGTK